VKPHKVKRPLNLIVFALWIAILGVISLMRSALLFQQMPTLLELGLAANWMTAALGMVWGVGLLGGAVGLWLRWEPARWAVLLLVPAYYLTHWLDWQFSARAGYARGRIGPYTVLSLAAIAFSTWFLARQRTRQHFQN
jgi:uncharacterized membrane protein